MLFYVFVDMLNEHSSLDVWTSDKKYGQINNLLLSWSILDKSQFADAATTVTEGCLRTGFDIFVEEDVKQSIKEDEEDEEAEGQPPTKKAKTEE